MSNASTTFTSVTITKDPKLFEDTDAITKEYVDSKIASIVGGAPENLNTIGKLAEAIKGFYIRL
jgi:hypothetical protein